MKPRPEPGDYGNRVGSRISLWTSVAPFLFARGLRSEVREVEPHSVLPQPSWRGAEGCCRRSLDAVLNAASPNSLLALARLVAGEGKRRESCALSQDFVTPGEGSASRHSATHALTPSKAAVDKSSVPVMYEASESRNTIALLISHGCPAAHGRCGATAPRSLIRAALSWN